VFDEDDDGGGGGGGAAAGGSEFTTGCFWGTGGGTGGVYCEPKERQKK
jgi:hypothetical protein